MTVNERPPLSEPQLLSEPRPAVAVPVQLHVRRDDTRYVSNSEMETFMDCKRKWMLQYWLRWQKDYEDPLTSAARDAGTVAHAAVEAYYTNGGHDKQAAIDEISRLRNEAMVIAEDEVAAKHLHHKVYDAAHAMVEGYFEWLEETGADAGLTFTRVEAEIYTDSPVEKMGVRGKVDQEIRDDNSGLYFVGDLKTTKEIERPIKLMNLGIPQALTYVWGLQKEHKDRIYMGAYWTILRNVKRGATSKPPFYARHLVRIAQPDLDAHELYLTGVLSEIQRTMTRLVHGEDHRLVAPPHRTFDCLWKCPFYDVCEGLNSRFKPEDIGEFGYHQYDPNARYSTGT